MKFLFIKLPFWVIVILSGSWAYKWFICNTKVGEALMDLPFVGYYIALVAVWLKVIWILLFEWAAIHLNIQLN